MGRNVNDPPLNLRSGCRGGFSLTCLATGRELRPVYGDLCDVSGGDVIRQSGIPTSDAGERLLGLSILFVDTTAFRTRPGGIPGR